jgi:hypothetical protein
MSDSEATAIPEEALVQEEALSALDENIEKKGKNRFVCMHYYHF